MRANLQTVLGTASAIFLMATGANALFCQNFTLVPQILCYQYGEYSYGCFDLPIVGDEHPYFTYRISPAAICTQDSPYYLYGGDRSCSRSDGGCLIPPQNGINITVDGMVNLTLNEADTADLFSLVSQTLVAQNLSYPYTTAFPTSASGIVNITNKDDMGPCFGQGWAAFVDYRPKMNCVTGTLFGCDCLPDGTPVKACAPNVVGDGVLDVSGFMIDFIGNDTASSLGSGPVPTPVQPISLIPTATSTDPYSGYGVPIYSITTPTPEFTPTEVPVYSTGTTTYTTYY